MELEAAGRNLVARNQALSLQVGKLETALRLRDHKIEGLQAENDRLRRLTETPPEQQLLATQLSRAEFAMSSPQQLGSADAERILSRLEVIASSMQMPCKQKWTAIIGYSFERCTGNFCRDALPPTCRQ